MIDRSRRNLKSVGTRLASNWPEISEKLLVHKLSNRRFFPRDLHPAQLSHLPLSSLNIVFVSLALIIRPTGALLFRPESLKHPAKFQRTKNCIA
ncbi:hypothetical protein RvY_09788 [Ramazzottius varieornatus]|uniref:Uncharacterized protein n=1 Tax=Ramazzottius varieornatus TaxID=947166 RepID=A0A1D1VF00_RAMVA|nr:hypothetical protein RvY_09788 [Ramazzottius varieornatus]